MDHQRAVKEYNRSAADKVSNLFLSVYLYPTYVAFYNNYGLFTVRSLQRQRPFPLFLSLSLSLSHLRLKICHTNFDLSQFFS